MRSLLARGAHSQHRFSVGDVGVCFKKLGASVSNAVYDVIKRASSGRSTQRKLKETWRAKGKKGSPVITTIAMYVALAVIHERSMDLSSGCRVDTRKHEERHD